ncbi:MAG TPA: uracil-DNA glycosylase [Allosphingosinicella sp.]|jgi:uracil-DNA glycosylase
MKELLGEEWYELMKDEFGKQYMEDLNNFVKQRRLETTIYPEAHNIFNAYRSTPYSNVKVCIVGQDPYIKPNQAHGLSFSVEDGSYTPSLRQIEKAIAKTVYGGTIHPFWNNNLTRWVDQGVMLLNNVLTVDKGVSNSHKGKGWEIFTRRTIEKLDKKGGVIFLLWGKDAQTLLPYIHNSEVITAEHPVAAVYRGGTWNCNDCFNKVNQLLKEPIIW